MFDNLKALAFVLPIAMVVFIIAKPVSLRFMAEADFDRRRKLWLALTAVAFLSTSFWMFFFVAFPIYAWASRKDTNPVAFYLLLMNVVPPSIGAEIPVVGINAIFRLDGFRTLALGLLVPVAWRLMRSTGKAGLRSLTAMDVLIVAYCGLQVWLMVPNESTTESMRRGFLLVIDYLVLYYVVSRSCTNQRAIVETMAAFGLVCTIYAPLAVFEMSSGWLLYDGISRAWGEPLGMQYQLRDGLLRARVSAGQFLYLGNMLAIGFGFWLYLRSRVSSMPLASLVPFVMWAGLIATYSRGPWVAAFAIPLIFLALHPDGIGRLLKALGILTLVSAAVLASPIGEKVIDRLPFVGNIGEENVDYRLQLVTVSWELILRNPILGNPNVHVHMESLRQGMGIIDIVNKYLMITLFHGLVGLCLYLGFFLLAMRGAYRIARSSAVAGHDVALLGSTLFACMVGMLLMMGIGGVNGCVDNLVYVLAGLAAGCAQVSKLKEPEQESQSLKTGAESRWRTQRH